LNRAKQIERDARFIKVLDLISKGKYGDPDELSPILHALSPGNDYYLLSADFPGYVKAQEAVDKVYAHQKEWQKRSILSTAGSAKFSSDRTIKEYAEEIWHIKPVRRPGPVPISLERLSEKGILSTGVVSSLAGEEAWVL